MDAATGAEPVAPANRTSVERTSDHDLVTTRIVNGPARIVYEAWTVPELLHRWWVPKSIDMSMVGCEVDARVGGSYRFVFEHPSFGTMAFHGRYLDVIPNERLVWTNEESDSGAVTTLTFEEVADGTRLVMHERYPSKEALDAALAEMEGGMAEQLDQLDELLSSLAAGA